MEVKLTAPNMIRHLNEHAPDEMSTSGVDAEALLAGKLTQAAHAKKRGGRGK